MPHEDERSADPSRGPGSTVLDADAVRAWCALALDALGRARADIDAINVYPVADGDTGTNLFLTMESAAGAVEAVFAGHEPHHPSLAEVAGAMAHGALIGARGNSGTILAQLLRGMAQVLSGSDDGMGGTAADGVRLRLALRRAAGSAYAAVARPVEGTILTVAAAAAHAAGTGDDCSTVAREAYEGARAALAETPRQLAALGRAGVVDAGGRGLVTLLAALVESLTGARLGEAAATAHEPMNGRPPAGSPRREGAAGHASAATEAPVGVAREGGPGGGPAAVEGPGPVRPTAASSPDGGACTDVPGGGPAFEVLYLLEAADEAVERLRAGLDALGDSLVVVGGDGLWRVHVHVDDAGAAVEAGVEAGRPYRIRITHFDSAAARPGPPARERTQRAVVAVVPGEGLADLCAAAGATAVLGRPGEPPASGELSQAIRRAHAREVVLLPNDAGLRHAAAAAAAQARAEGVRIALIPTRSAVQGIAALAVHEPGRDFDEDVVAMTSAAGSTRYAELAVAERQSWTTAGVCQAGDVLGLIDGDVAVIGADPADTATTVLDRMLSAGGELVTLVLSDEIEHSVAERLQAHVRDVHLAVDTVVYHGGRQDALLLIGVE